jgi:hypothetical protein
LRFCCTPGPLFSESGAAAIRASHTRPNWFVCDVVPNFFIHLVKSARRHAFHSPKAILRFIFDVENFFSTTPMIKYERSVVISNYTCHRIKMEKLTSDGVGSNLFVSGRRRHCHLTKFMGAHYHTAWCVNYYKLMFTRLLVGADSVTRERRGFSSRRRKSDNYRRA